MTMHDSTSSLGNRIVAGPLEDIPTGRSLLPAASYTDSSLHEFEKSAIFAGGWVWAGYTHWVAEPGSIHPVTVGGQPLLLIRDRSGGLRVFHNSCRHRGMAITEEPVQVAGRLQCPYHCWSFNLDGTLVVAPIYQRAARTKPADEVKEKLSLLPVRAAEWAGMVFVDLSGRDIPFDERIAPLAERWHAMDFDHMVLAEERLFDIDANWKLVVENFLDYYHLPFIHPQVGQMEVCLDIDDLLLGEGIVGGTYPNGADEKARKTEEGLPLLATVDALPSGQDIFCVFPNALVFAEGDWFQVIAVDPVAVDRTIEHMCVFVSADASGPEHETTVKELTDALFGVNEQDLPMLHLLQKGRHSPGSDHTNLVSYWDQVTAHFQQLVARRAEYGTATTTSTPTSCED